MRDRDFQAIVVELDFSSVRVRACFLSQVPTPCKFPQCTVELDLMLAF